LGLAIGDALGAAVEFMEAGSFPRVTGYRAGGPHGLKAGEWTDDTSMALALADSIATASWDLNDQANRYIAWWKHGDYSVNGTCFDIGITTRSALSRFQKTKDARTSGDPSERAAGNGSIMRLAPVPIRYANLFPDRLDELVQLLVESSLPTHASPQCQSACAYFGLVLAALISGSDRNVVLASDWPPLAALRGLFPLHPEIDEVAAGSFRLKRPPQIVGSGYVVKSLEAALWAFHDASNFREAVLRAVNLGDDTDTTGAVCGQLAGAYWGEDGIPAKWRTGLARKDMLEKALAGLLTSVPTPTAAGSYQLASEGTKPPTKSSYWVVPGLLLAGAYPGDPDPGKHRAKVQTLLAAGIRTFVNLMEERETNHAGEPFVPYDGLAKQLCPDVSWCRHPIRDLSAPTRAGMTAILDAIDDSLATGRAAYVHCWGGVGRTGTVVACWLLRHAVATETNVLEVLASLRKQDCERGHRPSPESGAQRQFVASWRQGC
jgi:ADP-ribosylglycohydrolase